MTNGPKVRRRDLLLLSFLLIAATVAWIVPARAVVHAANTLRSSTTYGTNCVGLLSGVGWNTGGGAYTFTFPNSSTSYDYQFLCALNPNPTAPGTGNSDNAIMAQVVAGASGCGSFYITCGSSSIVGRIGGFGAQLLTANTGGYSSMSNTCDVPGAYQRITNHGRWVNAAGTVLAAQNAAMPDNQFYMTLHCFGPTFGWSAKHIVVSDVLGQGGMGLVNQNNTCGAAAGASGMYVCFGSADASTFGVAPKFPDYWAGGAPPLAPCEGVGFLIREDGTSLSGSLTGHNTVPGSRYFLRVVVPTSGASNDATIWFDGDAAGDTVAPKYLGVVTVPKTTSPAYYQFDVTTILDALEDPTPDLGKVRVTCESTSQNGDVYWSGDVGLSTGLPPLTPYESAPGGAEGAGCFTFSGMSLTSPSSWVKGIGTMFVCLGTWAFVPTPDQLDTFMASIEDLTETPPLQWIVEGVSYVSDASFSFGTWDAVGPDCVSIMGSETCPSEWDDGVSVPVWLAGLLLFGLWTSTLVGIWRFFS